jgi:signal transduction histidine kinase
MDVLTTLLVAWAAVYGYVALYYGLVYLRRPADREYITFALVASGMCVYTAAKAVLLGAETAAEAVMPSRFTWVGLLLAVAFFVDHCHTFRTGHDILRRITYPLVGVAVGLSLAGLTVNTSQMVATTPVDWASATSSPSLAITPLGLAVLAVCLVLSCAALARLIPALPHDRDVRVLFGGATLAVATGVHDLAIRAGWLQSFYLLEHAALIVVVAMSYMLLHRFVRTNDELRLRTEELHRSYAELRRTQEKLVRKEQLAAVGELSAVIAHEVRNPLAIIKNAVSGLRRDSLEQTDRATLLTILKEETGRLARLVEDLLAYAQPMAPQGRAIHLDELVWGAVDLARSANPGAARVAFTVDLRDAPETVHGDPALLRQALTNIVDNAIQAMPGGGDLAVRACPITLDGAPAVAIEVEDTGEGMDALVRQKACNPFFTTRPAGTGLGLAIVERVTRNHGGTVSITSRHGAGTTVTLQLPHQAARPSAHEGDAPTPNADRPAAVSGDT